MNVEGFSLMSEVTAEPAEWLWPGYIPLGETTILEGHPGTNKSSLTADLAARLTRGTAMPCTLPQRGRKRKGVLIFYRRRQYIKNLLRAAQRRWR